MPDHRAPPDQEEYDWIREHLHLYSQVLDFLTDGVLVFDDALTVVYANKMARAQFNYTERDIIGLNLEKLVPPNSRPTHATSVAMYLARPVPRRMGGTKEPLSGCNREGNTFPCDIALSRIQSAGGSFTVAVVRTALYRSCLPTKNSPAAC